jgi:transcriptional regulator with XRE-family HTH domain
MTIKKQEQEKNTVERYTKQDVKKYRDMILNYRKERCISRKEFAKVSGISVNGVAKIEQGETEKINIMTIGKIEKVTQNKN